MENYCAFSKDHKCILWLDYEITRQELEECHTLCHGNWIEIEHKYKYIQELRHLLNEHGIPYPEGKRQILRLPLNLTPLL